jgi:hypothetical protein
LKRKHHFVSRFYLKAFASDKGERQIHVYNLKRGLAIEGASLRDQCYGHRFYGEHDDLEDAFAEVEGIIAPAIARAIEGQRAPENGSDDHKALIMFVALQNARTAAAMHRVQLAANLMADAVYDGAPPADFLTTEEDALTLSLYSLPEMMVGLSDLRIHAIVAPDGHQFITSDHPVCRFNHYCHGIKGMGVLGGVSRGLQIYVPLSSKVGVLLFDSGVYKVGKKGTAASSIATPEDVLRLNQLVFLAAHENLYFADWEMRGEVAGKVCAAVKGDSYKMQITEAVEEADDRSSLLHSYEVQPTLDIYLRFVHVRREARRVPLFQRARMYRKRLPRPELRGPPSLEDGRKHVFKVTKHWGK